jgi:mRNA interferase MazF
VRYGLQIIGLAAKARPILIISREDANPPRALVIYAPLTTQNRGSQYEVVLPKLRFLTRDSTVNVQGIGAVAIARLERKLGELSAETMEEIREAIVFALDLGQCLGQSGKMADEENGSEETDDRPER